MLDSSQIHTINCSSASAFKFITTKRSAEKNKRGNLCGQTKRGNQSVSVLHACTHVLSEMDFPGPRNSGSGDSGYGFVDLGGQLESNQVWVEGPALVASAYGPCPEGAGTRVCGYAIKNSGLTVVR